MQSYPTHVHAIIVPTIEGVKVELSSRHGHKILTTVDTVEAAKEYITDSYGRVTFRYDHTIGYETALI